MLPLFDIAKQDNPRARIEENQQKHAHDDEKTFVDRYDHGQHQHPQGCLNRAKRDGSNNQSSRINTYLIIDISHGKRLYWRRYDPLASSIRFVVIASIYRIIYFIIIELAIRLWKHPHVCR